MNKQENMNAKYIRTKGNIIPNLINECFEKQPLSYQTLGIKPIKFSDNIEELCDEFVFEGVDEKPYLCDNFFELLYITSVYLIQLPFSMFSYGKTLDLE